jgi:hypothetical protein
LQVTEEGKERWILQIITHDKPFIKIVVSKIQEKKNKSQNLLTCQVSMI